MLSPDFFDRVRKSKIFGKKITQAQVDGINAIDVAFETYGDKDIRKLAYIFATTVRETGGKMQPIHELGSAAYFTKHYEGRGDLGNVVKGDGARFHGRGYAQMTGRKNYRDWSKRIGVDLVDEPDRVLEPELAARILVEGSMLGTFTNKRLALYINDDKCDYYSARRVINGLDHANEIEANAKKFEAALRA